MTAEDTRIVRPGPLRWLWYAMGGGLPARNRYWVLHDVTVRTWALRQMLRSVVQLVPFGIVLVIVVPGPLWVRLVAVLGGALVGLVYAASFVPLTVEHRSVKAGFAPGEAEAVRDRLDAPRKEEAARRYRERYRPDEITPRSSE